MPDFYLKTGARQAGLSMLEALITLLLMSIIGMGIAYVTGKTLVAQRNTGAQYLAVSQMRQAVKSGDCAGAANVSRTVQIASMSLQANCRSENVTLTVVPAAGSGIASQAVVVAMPQVSVNSPQLGGEIIMDTVR